MCIIFVHTGGPTAGKYRLIVASNRDEFFNRPAKRAAPWDSNKDVIGGQDLQPGREGGTWLAASTARHRVAALLNLPAVPSPDNAKGRGSLVTDLVMEDKSSEDYIKDLRENSHQYSAFNLISIDIGKTTSNLHHYSNFGDELISFGGGAAVGFSNSSPDSPLKKAVVGTNKFNEIVNKSCSEGASEETLVEGLLSLLQSKERHLPDEVLKSRDPPGVDELASIFVDIPKAQYGTRTHTIILVDLEGELKFWEWTKVPGEAQWFRTHIKRHLLPKP